MKGTMTGFFYHEAHLGKCWLMHLLIDETGLVPCVKVIYMPGSQMPLGALRPIYQDAP